MALRPCGQRQNLEDLSAARSDLAKLPEAKNASDFSPKNVEKFPMKMEKSLYSLSLLAGIKVMGPNTP
jgi:hypothetical protein